MDSLEHSASGRFVVATESGSRYLLDFERQVFVRLPKPGEEDEFLVMRGDHNPVRLLRLVDCVVGGRMQLIIDLDVPGIAFTTRRTTAVLAIEDARTCTCTGTGSEELDTFARTLGQGHELLGNALRPLTEEEEPHGNS